MGMYNVHFLLGHKAHHSRSRRDMLSNKASVCHNLSRLFDSTTLKKFLVLIGFLKIAHVFIRITFGRVIFQI